MPIFSFPDFLDHQVVSELENHIIDICNSCSSYEQITSASIPLWQWASQILGRDPKELRTEIETHYSDEQLSSPYLEEKDHLLKLPLVLLEKINS
jgi:hypothetical protein